MKNFIQTLQNIFKIEDLRSRILNTLLFLLVYRLAAHVVLPGIDPTQLAGLRAQTEGGILGLLDAFSGGAFSQASVVALGIMPYISASIVVQLLGIAVPYFQKFKRKVKVVVRSSIKLLVSYRYRGYFPGSGLFN
jgi:preprotein translocase subunit SecY